MEIMFQDIKNVSKFHSVFCSVKIHSYISSCSSRRDIGNPYDLAPAMLAILERMAVSTGEISTRHCAVAEEQSKEE